MSSTIDGLFQKIFGFLPTKKGTAYEMLSAAVCKILSDNDVEIFHDEKIRGIFSKTLYQIDVLLTKDSEKILGEAKDYTDRGDKVGRGDLQKFGGAFGDLNFESGIFFSATDYTEPAKEYAKTSKHIVGKDISLFHLRPSIERDRNGRIETIVLTITAFTPSYEKADFKPIFTTKGEKKIQEMKTQGKLSTGILACCLEKIYYSNWEIKTTVKELTSSKFGGYDGDNAKGSFWIPNGYIDVMNELVEIHGITYDIPFKSTSSVIEIKTNGTPVILVKDEKGDIDKLITDEQLKIISFDENGKVKT